MEHDSRIPDVSRPANPNNPPSKKAAKKTTEVASPSGHELVWQQYEKYGKEPAPPPAKTALTVRIGVFFDGTGNNASNTAMGQLCGAHFPVNPQDLDAGCKPYMANPDSSYGNAITNVKKLFELYPEILEGDQQHKTIYLRVYVEGIGTNAGEKDNPVGLGAGRGDSGVAGRVQNAFLQIKDLVKDLITENPDCEITSLVFDAFGFSRGAAAARHFANELIRNQGPLLHLVHDNSKGFAPHFQRQLGSEVIIGFVGLFDTVASVAGVLNGGNIKTSNITPGVRLHLDRKFFINVVQLSARDERRANFALTRVTPDHRDIALPGVHSDIGGSYLDEAQETVMIGPMQGLTVAHNTDVSHTSIYHAAQQLKDQLVAESWSAEHLAIVTPPPWTLPKDSTDRQGIAEKRVFAGVQIKRTVRGELSRVYLRVMHALAKEKGVRFDPIDDSHPDYSIPTELQALSDRMVAGNYSVLPEEEVLLKRRYIHNSASWNNPIGKVSGGGTTLMYINAPTPDGVRVQHPHVPDWTLW
jgi:hypothetical protein